MSEPHLLKTVLHLSDLPASQEPAFGKHYLLMIALPFCPRQAFFKTFYFTLGYSQLAVL